jgi:Xaa-Pro aminopeptidase
MRLDSLARMSLWEYGYDFGHGVGHGVGHFLNVHEFPASIGYRFVNNEVFKYNKISTIMSTNLEYTIKRRCSHN